MPDPPSRYMWFYRTEVRNNLDVPLRVRKFEAFHWDGSKWIAGTIMKRELTAKDFSDWYGDGDPIVDGVIPPGGVAIDGRNWHASHEPNRGPTRWAYWAVDPEGKEHYAEVVVESVTIRSNEPRQ